MSRYFELTNGLLKSGIVSESKREELEIYINAREQFSSIFNVNSGLLSILLEHFNELNDHFGDSQGPPNENTIEGAFTLASRVIDTGQELAELTMRSLNHIDKHSLEILVSEFEGFFRRGKELQELNSQIMHAFNNLMRLISERSHEIHRIGESISNLELQLINVKKELDNDRKSLIDDV